MATVILRPTADSSLGHSCSSGSSGYALIADTSADGDSTYIYQSISGTSSASSTSKFKCSGTNAGKVKISSVTLTINAKTTKGNSSDTASISYSLTFGGKSGTSGSGTLSTSYGNFSKTYSASDLGLASTVFDSFDAASFIVTVTTSGKKSASKNDSFQNRVTQVYLTVTYENYVPVYYTCAAVAGDGIESATVSASSVESGGTCTFTATLSGSNTFAGWYSDSSYSTLVSTANPYTATISANTTLYAKANIVATYTVKAIAGDGIAFVQIVTESRGTVTSDYGGAVELTAIPQGETVRFYAVPKVNCEFTMWYDLDALNSYVADDSSFNDTWEKTATKDISLCAFGVNTVAPIYVKDEDSWTAVQNTYFRTRDSWGEIKSYGNFWRWLIQEYLRAENASAVGKKVVEGTIGISNQKFKVVST